MSIYLNNKYTKWYFNIINNNKHKTQQCYVEKHHIIPKSLGGDNKKSNLVNLTPKEHYILHHLLVKMTYGKNKHKMINAFWRLNYCNKHNITSRQYEYARNLISKYNSENLLGKNNPNFGNNWTTEQKDNMRLLKLGTKASDATKLKMSESRKGKIPWNKGVTGYTTKQKGFKHTEETKNRIRDSVRFTKNKMKEETIDDKLARRQRF